ncbi:hypothetical protein TcCL_Unassigned00732 [Trypanosoma cruzi]|nr:hypothetical protein TcCL_Unassigned00732 [Trypanosoma cruzi]
MISKRVCGGAGGPRHWEEEERMGEWVCLWPICGARLVLHVVCCYYHFHSQRMALGAAFPNSLTVSVCCVCLDMAFLPCRAFVVYGADATFEICDDLWHLLDFDLIRPAE